MTVWRISGDAANGSGGGDMVIFAVTASDTEPPDPKGALAVANPRGYAWSRIDSIQRIGELPSAWEERGPGAELLNAAIRPIDLVDLKPF